MNHINSNFVTKPCFRLQKVRPPIFPSIEGERHALASSLEPFSKLLMSTSWESWLGWGGSGIYSCYVYIYIHIICMCIICVYIYDNLINMLYIIYRYEYIDTSKKMKSNINFWHVAGKWTFSICLRGYYTPIHSNPMILSQQRWMRCKPLSNWEFF